ncbi:MAG: hypothetical protein L6R40_002601 [Gallowayella cf. fulva]|nr:MAG: hypothetical protein L6R40_002601 [Xanthomendoza cf. fulva]
MATVAYWLQRQRKPDLQHLASHIGMKNYDNLLKIELEVALDAYLRENQTRLQSDPACSGFYKRLDSPFKRERGGGTVSTSVVEEVKKPKQRRQTLKAREDLEPPSESDLPSRQLTMTSPASPRTPPASSSTTLSLARQLPLPASPSQLADRIEESTATLTSSVSDFYTTSFIPYALSSLRTKLSTVTSIQLLVLSIEAFGLFRKVVPLKYLTTIPAIPALGLTNPTALNLPDLFALLTSQFWLPVLLWLSTSIFIPSLAAWTLNLRHAYAQSQDGDGPGGYDPVTFGVVKGLVAWIIFLRNGLEGEAKGVVEGSVPGGGFGMVIGAGVGVLAGFWEGVLRK